MNAEIDTSGARPKSIKSSLDAIDSITLKYMANQNHYNRYLDRTSKCGQSLDAHYKERVEHIISHMIAKYFEVSDATPVDVTEASDDELPDDVACIPQSIYETMESIIEQCANYLNSVDRSNEIKEYKNEFTPPVYVVEQKSIKMTMNDFVKKTKIDIQQQDSSTE